MAHYQRIKKTRVGTAVMVKPSGTNREGVVNILRKKKTELTAKDYELMHHTISFISRHKAQKPSGNLDGTRWNYSLKNWGYDYSKEK